MKRAEILSIGDELLRGIVHESNAFWIAKRLAARAVSLERTTLLPDRPEIVAAEIRSALARSPDLLITHGGLGPTHDDRTREAIALALDAPAARDAAAYAIVERRYRELAADGSVSGEGLDPSRARMADLPRGAQALDNQVGTAPAFTIEAGATTVIALPGVPSELYWIWEGPLAPVLDRVAGPGGYAERTAVVASRDESRIAPLLERVQGAHPGVYLKSRASGFGPGDDVRVTVHATAPSDADAAARADACMADLRAALRAEGVEVSEPG